MPVTSRTLSKMNNRLGEVESAVARIESKLDEIIASQQAKPAAAPAKKTTTSRSSSKKS